MKFRDFSLVQKKDGTLDHIEINFIRPVRFEQEDIDDIMAAALEGGINYWCDTATIGDPGYLGTCASDQISRGGSLILVDREDEQEYTLNMENLIFGIGKAIELGYVEFKTANNRIEITDLDCQDADRII